MSQASNPGKNQMKESTILRFKNPRNNDSYTEQDEKRFKATLWIVDELCIDAVELYGQFARSAVQIIKASTDDIFMEIYKNIQHGCEQLRLTDSGPEQDLDQIMYNDIKFYNPRHEAIRKSKKSVEAKWYDAIELVRDILGADKAFELFLDFSIAVKDAIQNNVLFPLLDVKTKIEGIEE